MEELLLLDKLVRRNPEVYKEEWKCILCDQEQESWSHIWRCSHLLTRLIALQQATKQGFEDLLSVTVPNRSDTFTSTWNALPCWSLPSTSSNAIVTFNYLIRGFIPSSLMALLMTVTSRKEVTDITNNISHIAQDRKSTRLNSSHDQISYAVFCLKKKKNT